MVLSIPPQRANAIWKQMLKDYEMPPIDPVIDEALQAFIAKTQERNAGRLCLGLPPGHLLASTRPQNATADLQLPTPNCRNGRDFH